MPTRPMANSATRSIRFWPDWNAANEMIMNRNGARRPKGIVVSRAIPPEAMMQISVPATLASARSQTMA